MFNNAPSFRAGGTIPPSRFVQIDTSADNQVIVGGTGTEIIGISQVGQKRTPGLAGSDTAIAAEIGDVISVYSLGDVCPLTAGAAITRGALLKSDSTGRGVTATTGAIVGAVALQSAAAANVLIQVQIINRTL